MKRTYAEGRRSQTSPIDDVSRAVFLESNLNLLAARIFATGGGKDFLDYLKTITVSRICTPGVSNRELRHLEGARWLFGVIQARTKAGQKEGAIDYEPERPLEPTDPVP